MSKSLNLEHASEVMQKSARDITWKTMDVFNKIKSTVSGALPGNPVTRDYDIGNQQGTAGPGYLWKIYDAVKKNTKELASVWLLDKKSLEKFSKDDRDSILNSFKKGTTQLTKLRHPKILSVIHALEESRDSIAFATEPVFASLGNVLGNHNNIQGPIISTLQDYKLLPLEIRYGLLQIIEGLIFLHNSVKLVHTALALENIIINKNGVWKLFGFNCCVSNANPNEQAFWPCPEWQSNINYIIQPPLDFLAPEYIIKQCCDPACDMFAIGVLFHAVYNEGQPVYKCQNNIESFRTNIDKLRNLKNSAVANLPNEIKENVKLLLNIEPTLRPDAEQMSRVEYFQDIGVVTLQYLDSLFQHDNLEKSQFFKSLPQIITGMPQRIRLLRVIPCLAKEFSNKNMIPFLLPSVLLIAEKSSDKEYMDLIWPELKLIFDIHEPLQIPLILLQNMSLILSKTIAVEIKSIVLPMVYNCLDSGNSAQIQELCLEILPTFTNLIDNNCIKNQVLPRIKNLILTTSILSVRVNCLICIGKMLEYMDKWYIIDDIFPILQSIPSREPAVLMSILGIYKITFSHKKLGISKDAIANKVLPFIIPLAIDNSLNLKQFSLFIQTIRELLDKVESEHRSKLEQLHSMQDDKISPPMITQKLNNDSIPVKSTVGNNHQNNTTMDDFLTTTSVSKNNQKAIAAKVTLSMEEKQRLSKQSEQKDIFLKNQPSVLKPSTPNYNQSCDKLQQNSKDLLSTLGNFTMSTTTTAAAPMQPQSSPQMNTNFTKMTNPFIRQNYNSPPQQSFSAPFSQQSYHQQTRQSNFVSQRQQQQQQQQPMFNATMTTTTAINNNNVNKIGGYNYPDAKSMSMNFNSQPVTASAAATVSIPKSNSMGVQKSVDKTANDELKDIFG